MKAQVTTCDSLGNSTTSASCSKTSTGKNLGVFMVGLISGGLIKKVPKQSKHLNVAGVQVPSGITSEMRSLAFLRNNYNIK